MTRNSPPTTERSFTWGHLACALKLAVYGVWCWGVGHVHAGAGRPETHALLLVLMLAGALLWFLWNLQDAGPWREREEPSRDFLRAQLRSAEGESAYLRGQLMEREQRLRNLTAGGYGRRPLDT